MFISPKFSDEPWKINKKDTALFEIQSSSGETILRVKEGCIPLNSDANLMISAPYMYKLLKKISKMLSNGETLDNTMMTEIIMTVMKAEGKL